MLSIRLLINSKLFVIEFWEQSKLYRDFQLYGELVPLALMLFNGQLWL